MFLKIAYQMQKQIFFYIPKTSKYLCTILCPVDLRLDLSKAGLVQGRKCLAAGLGSQPEVSGSLLFGLVEVGKVRM